MFLADCAENRRNFKRIMPENFIHIALYIIYLLVFLRFIYGCRLFTVEGVSPLHLAAFFLLKVLAGGILTLVYTYYYTDTAKSDIYRYFNDSVVISKLLFQAPVHWAKIMLGVDMYNKETFSYLVNTHYFDHPGSDVATNNKLIIRLTSLFNYLSYYNIYINTLLFNFVSFIGLVAFLKALRRYFTGDVRWLYIPLFLLPSMVFWSSGLLKEQLLFAFIGFYIYVSCNSAYTGLIRILLSTIIIAAVFYVKPSVAICLFAASAFLPVPNMDNKKRWIGIAISIACLVSILIVADWHYEVCNMFLAKRNEFVALAISEGAGSALDNTIYEPGCGNLLSLIPSALLNTLLRPFIWNGGSVFQLAFALENLLFLGLLLYIVVRNFRLPKGDNAMFTLFCLAFAFLNYLIIGLTVPIMGAIVHYRVMAAPFLLLALLISSRLNSNKAE